MFYHVKIACYQVASVTMCALLLHSKGKTSSIKVKGKSQIQRQAEVKDKGRIQSQKHKMKQYFREFFILLFSKLHF